MLGVLQTIFHKTAVALTASVITLINLLPGTQVTIISRPDVSSLASIAQTSATPANISATLGRTIITLPNISAPVAKVSSTAIQMQNITARKVKVPVKTSEPKTTEAAIPAKNKVSITLASLTPDQFLNRTTSSLRQRGDGSYWMELHTNLADAGGAPDFEWDPSSPNIGGSSGIPQLSTSFNCNPPYNQSQSAITSPVAFEVNTAYSCSLSLTNGVGQVAQKQIGFTTGQGFLSVSGSHSGSYILKSDLSSNNIIFTNTDSNSVTVTGLTIDISSAAATFTPRSFIRLKDYNDNILYQYTLTDMPKDSSGPYTNAIQGVSVPLSFVVPAHSSKVLFVEVTNVSTLYVGIDPTITIAFRNNVAINKSNMRISFMQNPMTISWSCKPKFLQNEPDKMCH